MDDLPPPLILEILTRVNDSTDLARCKLVSKTLNSLSSEVPYINLPCSFDRYSKSRSSGPSSVTPFKTIFKNLVLNSTNLHAVTIGVEKPLQEVSYDDVDDEEDDLHLTSVGFVKEWLVGPNMVCESLRSVKISDFWVQSCWRRSGLLGLLSSHCHSLAELEIKNAWLSVDGLNPMPTLTSLTLEFIRLDDEDLNKVNECFPSLQVLKLIGVGGLKEPKIHLLRLKSCQWTVSNAPNSATIVAPQLVKLKLECVKPRSLVIEAPLLYDFHLSLEKASEFKVQEFYDLKNLSLESIDLCNLLHTLPFGGTVKNLTVESLKWTDSVAMITLEALFRVFPNVRSLTFGPGAWSELEICHRLRSSKISSQMKDLKEITAYLVAADIDISLSFILSVLANSTNLSYMALFIHSDVVSNDATRLMSTSMAHCSTIKWRWGRWKGGTKDVWISDGI